MLNRFFLVFFNYKAVNLHGNFAFMSSIYHQINLSISTIAMTTTMKCLCAFLLLAGLSFGQENQELYSYQYSFEVEFIPAQADEGTIKDIKAFSKDLFEVHPNFSQGVFEVFTSFPVPTDRLTQHLASYGFTVTAIRVELDGKVLTTETSEL